MKIINEPSILNATSVKISNGCHPNRMVLRHVSDDEVMPYVVHRENLKVNGDFLIHRDFYSGQYFDNLKEAEEYFKQEARYER